MGIHYFWRTKIGIIYPYLPWFKKVEQLDEQLDHHDMPVVLQKKCSSAWVPDGYINWGWWEFITQFHGQYDGLATEPKGVTRNDGEFFWGRYHYGG